jgi:FkbM family methyltransferase
MYSILDITRRTLAKSELCTWMALKLRNQANMVVAYHLTESSDQASNGEEEVMKCIAPHCESFVDVGANLGQWTSRFLSHTSKTVKGMLFEPGSYAFKHIQEEFKQLDNITLIKSIVGEENGSMDFFEEPDAGQTSSVIKEFALPSAQLFHLPIVTLDSELSRQNWTSVDLLKIDAEGYDYKVMLGAKQLFSERRIGFVQFEYNTSWARSSSTLIGAFQFLEKFDYSCYLIRSDGLFELNYPKYSEYFHYSNFLAVSPARQNVVQPLLKGKI